MKTKIRQSQIRPSGIDWIGDIPEGWSVSKFKANFIANTEKVKDHPTIDTPLSISGYRGVEPRNVDSMEGQLPSEDTNSYRIVRVGQLAVNTMWLNYAGLGVSDYEGYVSPAYMSYRIKNPNLNPRFVHHLMRSPLYVQKYSSLLYGVRPNSLQVKSHDFEKIEIIIPPLEVQKKIADFLDEQISKIDQIIEGKQKVIELLKEKRVSFITRVVTGGLNTKVKVKSPGVRWFDDIPQHWHIRKMKFLITSNDGGVWGEADDPDGQPVLRSTEITATGKWQIDEKEIAYRALTKDEIFKGLLKEGDLLVTKSSGSEEHIGKTAFVTAEIADKRYCYSNFMQRLRANDLVHSKTLYYFMNSHAAREQYKYLTNSTTGLGNLNADTLNSLCFLLIPKEEQGEITCFLDKEVEKIDLVIEKNADQAKKLQEYRASLIYSAVTGKIEV